MAAPTARPCVCGISPGRKIGRLHRGRPFLREALNMSPRLPSLALTAGEPAGIGPDLCVLLAQKPLASPLVVIADRALLAARAEQLRVPLRLQEFTPLQIQPHQPGTLCVMHHALATPARAGILNPANSAYVLDTLKSALMGCRPPSGRISSPIVDPATAWRIALDSRLVMARCTSRRSAMTSAAPVTSTVKPRSSAISVR